MSPVNNLYRANSVRTISLPIITLLLVLYPTIHAEIHSCFKCTALCEGSAYEACLEAAEPDLSCQQQISCCRGSDLQDLWEVDACQGRCITEFTMKNDVTHTVSRRCEPDSVLAGRSVEGKHVGILYDSNDECTTCTHHCFCSKDFCNKAGEVSDCFWIFTGGQKAMVWVAVVLVILFIANEVFWIFKHKQLGKEIVSERMRYNMLRNDYKKTRFSRRAEGDIMNGQEEPSFHDKNEIDGDYFEKINIPLYGSSSMHRGPSQKSLPSSKFASATTPINLS